MKAVRQSAIDAVFAEAEGSGDLPESQSESDWDTVTDQLPELTPDEFEHLCDRLFASEDDLPDAYAEPVGAASGVGVPRSESSNGTLVVPALAGRNRPKASVRPSPRAGRVRQVTPPRRSARQRSLLWLAACLIPAAFCFWQAAAPTPTRPTPTAPASPRYVTRSIEDIREGDMVLAREEFGRDVRGKRVVQTYRRVSDHLRILTFRDPDGTEQTLRTTDEHPFWAENRQAWIQAGELKMGDSVTGPHGELQTLAATVCELHPEGIPVFNFQVEDYHSYFAVQRASTAVPLLAHNSEGGVCGYLPQPDIHKHHVFPQAETDWFRARGIEPNDYTVRVNETTHLRGTHGRGGFVGPNSVTLTGR